jgi:hypothetical protein
LVCLTPTAIRIEILFLIHNGPIVFVYENQNIFFVAFVQEVG